MMLEDKPATVGMLVKNFYTDHVQARQPTKHNVYYDVYADIDC